jgi:phage terminase large subunit-like protein
VDRGIVTTTPGQSIEYASIRHEINELAKRYKIEEIACDRWNADQLIKQLSDDGFTAFAFGQGYKDMSPASKELERNVLACNLRTNRNPVMRWMVGNVAIDSDPAGNIKPNKANSTGRIDGVVALIMGLARAALADREDACGVWYLDDEPQNEEQQETAGYFND